MDIQQLLFAKGDLYFVLVNPKFEAPTAEMRAVLPKMVPMLSAINNSAMGGSLVGHIVIRCCSRTFQSNSNLSFIILSQSIKNFVFQCILSFSALLHLVVVLSVLQAG